MSQDPFEGGQDVKPNQVSFGKKGDFIIGFYSGKKDIQTDRGTTYLYEVIGEQGHYHNSETTQDDNGNKVVKVDEKPTPVEKGEYYTVWGGKDAIDDLFKKASVHQKVGIRFEDAIPSKKKGNSPFKVMKTVMWDEHYDPLEGAGESQVEGIDV